MHKRPSLSEALNTLRKYSDVSDDCALALEEYSQLVKTNEFLAARYVVDIIDHFNHIQATNNNGKTQRKNTI